MNYNHVLLKLSKYTDHTTGFTLRIVNGRTEAMIYHSHEYYEIFLTLDDNIVHIINEERINMKKGTVVLIRPSDRHTYFYDNTEVDWFYVNFTFTPDIFHNACSFLGNSFPKDKLLTAALPPSKTISSHKLYQLENTVRNLSALNVQQQIAHSFLFRQLLLNMLVEQFSISTQQDYPDVIPPWLLITCEQIRHMNPCFISISKMVEISKKTKEHLIRSMQKYLNQTPSEFINDLRITYASTLLSTTSDSITDICYASGFNNISWFYSVFKNKYGITPKQYRAFSSHTDTFSF